MRIMNNQVNNNLHNNPQKNDLTNEINEIKNTVHNEGKETCQRYFTPLDILNAGFFLCYFIYFSVT